MIQNKKFSTELIYNEEKWQVEFKFISMFGSYIYIYMNKFITPRMIEFMAGVASGWKIIGEKRSKQKRRWTNSYNSLFPPYLYI